MWVNVIFVCVQLFAALSGLCLYGTMRDSLSLRRAFASCSSRLAPWSTTVFPADDCRDEGQSKERKEEGETET